MLLTLSTWAVLFALYLMFAGQATGSELCAGALVAMTGAALQIYLHRMGEHPLRLRAPWGRLAARAGISLVCDTLTVGRALLRASIGRPVHGVIQAQGFIVDGTREAGRRAAVILAASIAPNGFVTKVVAADQALKLHRLVAAPAREDRLWPV
ncbi:MAG TPA: hypothetical protein VJ779_20470 [Acetobacteraceae bacterium]|jgi:hypothetical protein|nr:hypothetical protein [Acetobacteraceae bacterium]